MLRDLLLCILATLNILIFSFLELNQEAVSKMRSYHATFAVSTPFDEILVRAQHRIAAGFQPIDDAKVAPSSGFFLVIPKINLITPVMTGTLETSASSALHAGALSLSDFITPPLQGRTVVFGHSSDYPWNNNPYATVFTLLPKLAPGDLVTVIRGREQYAYRVEKILITDPTLSGVTDAAASNNELVLSTCYPLGFFSQRFTVVALPVISHS